jgi:hypothetical protein
VSASSTAFIADLKAWADKEIAEDIKRFGTKVAIEALQTASRLAAVRTGAMKAHIRVWVGTPDESFDASVVDQAKGTYLSGAQLMQSIARLNAREKGTPCGIIAAAPYSDYVNRGTSKMAAQPFWQAALEAADQLVLKQSDPRFAESVVLW